MINKQNGLEDVGQVKFGEKLDRANFKFADADGGKLDPVSRDEH